MQTLQGSKDTDKNAPAKAVAASLYADPSVALLEIGSVVNGKSVLGLLFSTPRELSWSPMRDAAHATRTRLAFASSACTIQSTQRRIWADRHPAAGPSRPRCRGRRSHASRCLSSPLSDRVLLLNGCLPTTASAPPAVLTTESYSNYYLISSPPSTPSTSPPHPAP